MADPLRQAYLPLAKREIGEIEAVWSVTDMRSPTEIETEHVDMIAPVPIRQLTLLEIQSATEVDAELKALVTMIKQDWPKSKADITLKFQKYFPFREEISTQDGVMFKGKRILVPFTLRQLMAQIEFPISSFTKYMPVT